jgi:hypothetical protein
MRSILKLRLLLTDEFHEPAQICQKTTEIISVIKKRNNEWSEYGGIDPPAAFRELIGGSHG